MWNKSENSETHMPPSIERSGNYVILRRNFIFVEESDSHPAHYEYEEWQMSVEQYEIYRYFSEQIDGANETSEIIRVILGV